MRSLRSCPGKDLMLASWDKQQLLKGLASCLAKWFLPLIHAHGMILFGMYCRHGPSPEPDNTVGISSLRRCELHMLLFFVKYSGFVFCFSKNYCRSPRLSVLWLWGPGFCLEAFAGWTLQTTAEGTHMENLLPTESSRFPERLIKFLLYSQCRVCAHSPEPRPILDILIIKCPC